MSSPYLQQLIEIAKTDLPQIAHEVENASTIYYVQAAVRRLHNVIVYLVHHVIDSDPSIVALKSARAAAAVATPPAAPALPPPAPGHKYVRGSDGRIYMIPVEPAQVPVPVAVGHPPAVNIYPQQVPVPTAPPAAPMHLIPSVAAALPFAGAGLPILGGPADGSKPAAAPTAEITITPQGSRVAIGGMPPMILPPGVPVDAASMVAPAPPTVTPGYPPGYSGVPGYPPPLGMPGTATPASAAPAEVVITDGGNMSPEVAAALARRSTEPPMMDASGGARNVTDE